MDITQTLSSGKDRLYRGVGSLANSLSPSGRKIYAGMVSVYNDPLVIIDGLLWLKCIGYGQPTPYLGFTRENLRAVVGSLYNKKQNRK